MSADSGLLRYDFRRPNKFSRDQIQTLATLHENFARLATVTLSASLRQLVSVHLSLVDQVTYSEFTSSLANPTTLAIGSMQPLKGAALLEINPAITFSLLDRLFGGPGDGTGVTRDLTEIEQATMEGLLVRLWANLGTAWGLVVDLKPQLIQLEVNPMFAQIVPPTEMVVLVALQVNLGNVVGTMNLVLPYLTLQPLVTRLSSEYWYSRPRSTTDLHEKAAADRTSTLPLNVEVLLEGESLSLRDLGALKKGSLVALPGAAGEAFLRVGGQTLFQLREDGRPGLAYRVEASPHEVLPRAPEAEAQIPGLQRAVENLRAGFETSVSGITGRLDELQRQQAVVSDLLSAPTREPQRPFSFLAEVDPKVFLQLLSCELPQLVAMILAHLDAPLAAVLLGGLDPALQPEVARRIASLEVPSPDVVAMVELVIKRKLEVVSSGQLWGGGGLDHLIQILSVANRSTESHVLEVLSQVDPSLADEVKAGLLEP